MKVRFAFYTKTRRDWVGETELSRGEEIREIERNRRYIFTDDKLTANLFALPAASARPIKYS